jgi:hypothetical protein
MSPQYDPVLAVWHRRRARDSFISVQESSVRTTDGQVAALLAMVEQMQAARIEDAARITALENLIEKIATAGG